jgi:predicted amidophosphoribosyltransferase
MPGILELLIILGILGLLVGGVVVVIVVVLAASKRQGGSANPNLFPCPDCGRHVSRLAASCPNCGRPFSSEGHAGGA